jgi:hypothetical protein
MTVYGSRDKNPFNVPKEYEINGVKTQSNNGNARYYLLVDSVTGDTTIKTADGKLPSSVGGNTGMDRVVGTIPKDGVFKPVVGSTTSQETQYFNSAVGQKAVKNHAVTTAQKAGAQNAHQLIFPNSATPGAGQGQNAPIPGVAGSTSGGAGGVSDADFKAGISDSKKTRSQFPTLKYPETLDAGKQDVIKFSMLKYSPKAFQTTKDNLGGFADRPSIGKDRNAIGVVTLPIPNGISDSNTLNWGDTTMNAAEALAANLALSGIKGGGQGLTDTAGKVAGAVQSNSGEVAGGMAALFAGLAVQGNAASILQRTEGAVINPNLELLFNAPTLRPFNFTFKLASRSETESKIIRSIIRFFKQGSAAQKSESNLFLKAPHTFQIQYLHRGEEHKFLNKFKECALQSFGVSYTPEGQYATFTDGAMVSYQITMQFQELEPIFNDDYTNDGTNPSPDIGF